MPNLGDRRGVEPGVIEYVDKVCAVPPGGTRRGIDGCGSVGLGWYPARWLEHSERDDDGRIYYICNKCFAAFEKGQSGSFREGVVGDPPVEPVPRNRLEEAQQITDEDAI